MTVEWRPTSEKAGRSFCRWGTKQSNPDASQSLHKNQFAEACVYDIHVMNGAETPSTSIGIPLQPKIQLERRQVIPMLAML
uniref:Uncharacterized protein n=1 Tax=Coccidioides posadasii RMSCC 3488 TaxID=454284 RepID=A0A0J6I009_COCPO|nr:hypothetical protein CPAG_00929 [Coccidioides posadasii RMSCC 3488]